MAISSNKGRSSSLLKTGKKASQKVQSKKTTGGKFSHK